MYFTKFPRHGGFSPLHVVLVRRKGKAWKSIHITLTQIQSSTDKVQTNIHTYAYNDMMCRAVVLPGQYSTFQVLPILWVGDIEPDRVQLANSSVAQPASPRFRANARQDNQIRVSRVISMVLSGGRSDGVLDVLWLYC